MACPPAPEQISMQVRLERAFLNLEGFFMSSREQFSRLLSIVEFLSWSDAGQNLKSQGMILFVRAREALRKKLLHCTTELAWIRNLINTDDDIQ